MGAHRKLHTLILKHTNTHRHNSPQEADVFTCLDLRTDGGVLDLRTVENRDGSDVGRDNEL